MTTHDILEKAKKAARSKGGLCLSKSLTNSKTKLTFQCDKGHRWDTTPHSVINGTWCKICGFENARRKRSDSIQTFIDIAKARHGKCTSEEYFNQTTKLSFICKRGHSFLMRASVVKRGAWCQACQKLENLEQIKNKYSKKITDELELKCKQNKGRSTLDFYILEDSSFSIYNLHNYPNPVSKNMKIGFELRSPEENLTIDLRFYSASGHLMGKEKHVLTHVGWRVDIPVQTDFSEWPSGVYFYRLFIVSRGGQIATKAKQLIKLN